MQLKDKETGKIVDVIEIRDGWVYYHNGQTRLDYLYEFFDDVGTTPQRTTISNQ